jgi:hypothetical protein
MTRWRGALAHSASVRSRNRDNRRLPLRPIGKPHCSCGTSHRAPWHDNCRSLRRGETPCLRASTD